jgi:hypothetical protein
MKTWDSGKLARDQENVACRRHVVCQHGVNYHWVKAADVHDKVYRFGTLVVDFPTTPNYPVEIRRDGSPVGGEYRATLKRGYLDGQPLSDAEILWLLGFDDEVADHEQAYRAMVEQ